MNGRERVAGQVVPCAAMRELMLITAGGVRLEILRSLMKEAKDVSTLADDLELGLSMVSGNLRLLRDNDLVEVERIKKNRIYSMSDRMKGDFNGRFIRLRIRSEEGEWLAMRLLLPTRRTHQQRTLYKGEVKKR